MIIVELFLASAEPETGVDIAVDKCFVKRSFQR